MDFLTFKSFISIPALISFYYLGALVFPVFIWLSSAWLIKRLNIIEAIHDKGKKQVWGILNVKQKLILTTAFLTMFLFMELFWRMLFEFLIAYLQMRDALLQ